MLLLLFVALWFILRGDLFYVLCYFVLVFFISISIAITSYVCLLCACLVLSVASSSWCLEGAAVCDCGAPLAFLLPFLRSGKETGSQKNVPPLSIKANKLSSPLK